MEATPFLIQADASGEALDAIGEQEKAYSEGWLQQLLRQHPDILPAAEFEPVFAPLISIGCEVGTGAGSIDNLFISPRGYLVLVETKLWRNPQARREVVAQTIDYAASLSRWTYGKLDEAVQAYLKTYENIETDLLSWVEQQSGPVEGGRHFFEETVAKNLRLGRFLTMVVGDRVRQSLVDMLNHVNRYPHLAADVALVEMHCYRWHRGQDWPLLVVPRIVARTQVVERSVIQVTVRQDGSHDVEVWQEKAEPSAGGRRRVTMAEEAFWELLGERTPDALQDMRRLIERYRATDGVAIDPTESGLAARFEVPNTGVQVTVFFVNSYGTLSLWPGTSIRNQLATAGLDREIAQRYGDQMRKIMNAKSEKEFNCSITRVDLGAFMAAVDAFIEEVRRAAADR